MIIIKHSAKGTEWENHKYLKRTGSVNNYSYTYKEEKNKGGSSKGKSKDAYDIHEYIDDNGNIQQYSVRRGASEAERESHQCVKLWQNKNKKLLMH